MLLSFYMDVILNNPAKWNNLFCHKKHCPSLSFILISWLLKLLFRHLSPPDLIKCNSHPLRHIIQSPAVHQKNLLLPSACSLSFSLFSLSPLLSLSSLSLSLLLSLSLCLSLLLCYITHSASKNARWLCMQEGMQINPLLPVMFITWLLPISGLLKLPHTLTPELMPNSLNLTARTENTHVSHYQSINLLTVTFLVTHGSFRSHRPWWFV